MDTGLKPGPQYPLIIGIPADNDMVQPVHRLLTYIALQAIPDCRRSVRKTPHPVRPQGRPASGHRTRSSPGPRPESWGQVKGSDHGARRASVDDDAYEPRPTPGTRADRSRQAKRSPWSGPRAYRDLYVAACDTARSVVCSQSAHVTNPNCSTGNVEASATPILPAQRDPSRPHAPPKPLFTRWIETKAYQAAVVHLLDGRPSSRSVQWRGGMMTTVREPIGFQAEKPAEPLSKVFRWVGNGFAWLKDPAGLLGGAPRRFWRCGVGVVHALLCGRPAPPLSWSGRRMV